MDDECVITRPVSTDGELTGTLDLVTAEIDGETAATVVYPDPTDTNPGRCSLSTVGPASTDTHRGGAVVPDDEQWVSLPLAYFADFPGAEPAVGDLVTMTASRRDPGVVGSLYEVKRVVHKTFSVSRKLIVGVVLEPEAG